METIIFPAPDGTKAKLDAIAERNNRSRAGEIRAAIDKHISEWKALLKSGAKMPRPKLKH